jgi:hypothetical protein
MTYLLIFVLAFLGTIAGHAVLHHGIRALQIRQVIKKSVVESRSEHTMCTNCKTVVARYEAFEDGTVFCANCIRERQPRAMRES